MDPEPQPFGQPFPLPHVPPDALLTLLNKRLDTIRLDFLLGMNAQFLADFDLDRQPVRIPACFPLAVITAHRPVAGKEVLDGTGQAMARMRHAVGRGRPFVEDELRTARSLLQRLLVDLPILPPTANAGFQFRKVDR